MFQKWHYRPHNRFMLLSRDCCLYVTRCPEARKEWELPEMRHLERQTTARQDARLR